jgi:hypothetical protein
MGSSLRKLQTVGLVVLMLGVLVGLCHENADAGPPRLVLYPMAPGGIQPGSFPVGASTPQITASVFPVGVGNLGSALYPTPFQAQQQQGGGNIGVANALNNLAVANALLNPFPVIGGVGGKIGGIGLNGMYGGY